MSGVYAYSPYGTSTTLGPDDGNSIQFTGRENDGTGLIFNRLRYRDPVLGWLSEDPIGLRGGLNVRAYVRGNPIAYTDPLGLINYLKLAVAVGNSVQAGYKIGTGSALIVGSLGVGATGAGIPVSLLGIAGGAWQVRSGIAAGLRARKIFEEALNECPSDAAWQNLLGLLPFGQHLDDPDENYGQVAAQDFLNRPLSERIIFLLTEGFYF